MSTERPAIPLAIALHYEAPGAPRVVAKGRGAIGEKIIETARAAGVPIEENAGLAAALSDVELGDEIPEELYRAVAEVLTFILRLSGKLPRAPAPPVRSPSGAPPAAALR
ncbi:EscU/YscU/HrcU family type III secretion system export apparatus switch protein [Rhodoplanes roseus]|uniref:Type III secretion protein n=1 Tax=Rhodoplanes roseus TaxID=29409 RepID=A0A327L2G1_9BRAD|nr:EscU/YscU/HrcU family type III secretion system export apparatus switch protein [Rhodoplanes roseus]RAI45129.1 type III secretion protein [Rhodoplanes roseus]